tara:strand:+ start:259 stop:636 length:378 start_codon:yes stop_codon:yes gene_type:complete
MSLFKRFIYYLLGVSLGSIIVYFIWTGKEVSFDYGMDARTLKTIRTKALIYSETADSYMKKFKIDSLAIQYVLTKGDVNFGKSNQHKEPCPEYSVTGEYKDRRIDLWIIRCESTSTIEIIEVLKE